MSAGPLRFSPTLAPQAPSSPRAQCGGAGPGRWPRGRPGPALWLPLAGSQGVPSARGVSMAAGAEGHLGCGVTSVSFLPPWPDTMRGGSLDFKETLMRKMTDIY